MTTTTDLDKIKELANNRGKCWIIGRVVECDEPEVMDLTKLAQRARRGARLLTLLTTPDLVAQESVYASACEGIDRGVVKSRKMIAEGRGGLE